MSLVTSSPTVGKVPSDVLDHATSEIAVGSKMDESVKAKVGKFIKP